MKKKSNRKPLSVDQRDDFSMKKKLTKTVFYYCHVKHNRREGKTRILTIKRNKKNNIMTLWKKNEGVRNFDYTSSEQSDKYYSVQCETVSSEFLSSVYKNESLFPSITRERISLIFFFLLLSGEKVLVQEKFKKLRGKLRKRIKTARAIIWLQQWPRSLFYCNFLLLYIIWLPW